MKKLILLLILIFSLPVAAQNFTIGKSTFLLNGKPFTVKAAELHYTRIPAPYWEHRIEMCKALGMNTICLYVFWNIHEQTEGQFDFTGQNDIAAFCRLAQKHGMYVIVRPGPYVCAEWEMGGLPWWLLKKKDIVLRTLDPYFMERTAIFMKEVGKQLAPLQITRGGNIIMVQGIKDMLDRNISFSLYMAHGGTTFGHWGGANNPSYSAMCSSYDYDAPISEPGWTTDKYFQLRDLLKNYLPAGEQLPEIPEAFPVIEIPEVEFTQIAPLFSNLPEAKESMDIQPMEAFDQGWGTILYRTTLQEPVENGTTMKITEVHDWAQVFADGKLLARLDRRRGEFVLQLPALKKGTRIDILVEAMGRVNFDESIHDRKGITEKVELVRGKQSAELKNWTVYSFPVDYSFVQDKRYKNGTAQTMPAYYRTTFRLDKVGDTFLDMSTWGKGMVWVNGLAIGRFWEIGPQQTLFMPGCWLKEGENEVIVLDLKGPEKASIRGLKKPILDWLRNEGASTHRKEGEQLDLSRETPVAEGTFVPGNGWQEVCFDRQSIGRYFCLEALSAQKGKKIAAIAELDVLGADGKPISREKWRIRYADSEETRSGNCTGDKVFDLQESTYWMTVAKDAYPHQLVIDLGGDYTVTGFRYLPRAEKGYPGMIKDYRVYVKGEDFQY